MEDLDLHGALAAISASHFRSRYGGISDEDRG